MRSVFNAGINPVGYKQKLSHIIGNTDYTRMI